MLTNFGGRSAKVNSKVQISVRLRHFDQAKREEKSPRKRPNISLLSYYVIARSDRLCRAVAIPRKGTLCVLVEWAPKARVVHPLLKLRRSAKIDVRGPGEELPMQATERRKK